MKKFVLIPDSFKGTMSSSEICCIMKSSIKKYFPDSLVVSIPVADGGEGSVDAFLSAVGGEKIFINVKGPYMENTKSFYGLINNKSTAVIEMAAAAGLPMVEGKANPAKTTTYGVGQLILDAANKGCKKIIIGLGGSATNDGGCGMACALGVKFFNDENKEFIPVGGTLDLIKRIDVTNLNKKLKDIEIITMCDIDNPLYGINGAAYIFAPQKGADKDTVIRLDKGLKNLDSVVKRDLNKDMANYSGAGAAGGMGFGMSVFLSSKLQMGIDTVLDTVGFDEILKDTDFVFSGEGKIDSQSIRGKVVIGVAKRTKQKNIPLIAVVGDIGDNIEAAYNKGVTAIFSINRVAVDFKQAKNRSKSDMSLTMNNLMNFMSKTKF